MKKILTSLSIFILTGSLNIFGSSDPGPDYTVTQIGEVINNESFEVISTGRISPPDYITNDNINSELHRSILESLNEGIERTYDNHYNIFLFPGFNAISLNEIEMQLSRNALTYLDMKNKIVIDENGDRFGSLFIFDNREYLGNIRTVNLSREYNDNSDIEFDIESFLEENVFQTCLNILCDKPINFTLPNGEIDKISVGESKSIGDKSLTLIGVHTLFYDFISNKDDNQKVVITYSLIENNQKRGQSDQTTFNQADKIANLIIKGTYDFTEPQKKLFFQKLIIIKNGLKDKSIQLLLEEAIQKAVRKIYNI